MTNRPIDQSTKYQSMILPVFLYTAIVDPFSTNPSPLSTRWSFRKCTKKKTKVNAFMGTFFTFLLKVL